MAAVHSVWSELPHHLLGLIFHHLSYPDLIRSHAVCKSWLLALKSIDMLIKTHSPMLLLAGDEIDHESEFRTLFSLAEKKSYRLYLPQIRGRRILASTDGWLITVDDAAELHLFNPFTHAEHTLPSITTLSEIKSVECDSITGCITGYIYDAMPRAQQSPFNDLHHMLLYFYHRAVIFNQSSSSEIVVFIIYGEFQDLAFVRLGDECWTELLKISPDHSYFTDVILHKGHYYGVNIYGFCIAFDISSYHLPKVIYEGPQNDEVTVLRHYLSESSDGESLMHMWRHDTWLPEEEHDGVPSWDGVYKTESFTVFLLDMIKNKMIKVERLEEGTTLFLGDNRSMLLRTQDLPELKENCIYFTDGVAEHYIPHPHMRRDIGIFNMTTGNVEPLCPSESILNLLTWPPPVWFTLCQS